jgi:hypothetical protein
VLSIATKSSLQRARRFRLLSERLDHFRDVLGLGHLDVAKVSRPIKIRAHFFDHLGKARECFRRSPQAAN